MFSSSLQIFLRSIIVLGLSINLIDFEEVIPHTRWFGGEVGSSTKI